MHASFSFSHGASAVARQMQRPTALATVAALCMSCIAAHAQVVERNTSPLPLPTFTCANPDPADALTSDALSNPGTVLNTTAPNTANLHTDRGNQPRWAYAYDPAAIGSHTVPAETVGATENIPTSYTIAGDNPPDLGGLPALQWQHFSGRELFAYNGGSANNPTLNSVQSLASVGFYLSNPNGGAASNQTRLLRYQFYLAPEVDPATYVLTLGSRSADDRHTASYINDERATSLDVLGGGATPAQQWRTGLNTLTIALFDTSPSATRFGLTGATASNCTSMRTLALSQTLSATQATPAVPITISGTAQATPAGGGTAVPLPVGTPVTVTITGPGGYSVTLDTTVTGTNGEYSVDTPTGLAPGSYTVNARLTDQPTVVAAASTFAVVAAAGSAGNVAAVPSLGTSALVLLAALMGAAGMGQRRRSRD
ncbi:MAG: IPTL-CTERM sorting domain-containing protein [Pseudomonadota bacterium]|nr:IPTL-CTERM sorting domain-containing protein [Pseudomonadota bacterium]